MTTELSIVCKMLRIHKSMTSYVYSKQPAQQTTALWRQGTAHFLDNFREHRRITTVKFRLI